VSYVDAGYAIALTTLACYGLVLAVRRRRLARAAARAAPAGAPAPPGAGAPDAPRRGS
jgi:hypothetical protein